MCSHDQREAEPQIRAISPRKLGPPGKAAEDLDALPFITHELDRNESLTREQIQPRDQGLARSDQLGAGGCRARRSRSGTAIQHDPTHRQATIGVPGLGLISWAGRYRRPRLRSRSGLPLGGIQLEYGLGRDALQGSVKQEKTFEDRLAERDVSLLEPVLTLTIELLFDVPVGQDGKNRHGHKGAAHEQCKKPATEPAPQRCRRKSQILAHVEWLGDTSVAGAFPDRASVMPPKTPP